MGYLERKFNSHDNDSSKDYEHEWQMKVLNQMWQLYRPRQIVPGSIGVIRHSIWYHVTMKDHFYCLISE